MGMVGRGLNPPGFCSGTLGRSKEQPYVPCPQGRGRGLLGGHPGSYGHGGWGFRQVITFLELLLLPKAPVLGWQRGMVLALGWRCARAHWGSPGGVWGPQHDSGVLLGAPPASPSSSPGSRGAGVGEGPDAVGPGPTNKPHAWVWEFVTLLAPLLEPDPTFRPHHGPPAPRPQHRGASRFPSSALLT